jgi:membrane protease YdiL (CAAX protease family)
MPDPTEPVITAAFGSALALFAIAAVIRKAATPAAPPLPVLPPDAPLPSDADPLSPYFPPATAPVPPALPPLPGGRVPTWFFRRLDLLGAGFIFLVFSALVISSVQAGAKTGTPALDPQNLIASIGFQFFLAGLVTVTLLRRVRPVEWLGLRWPGWKWSLLIAPAGVLGMWAFFAGLDASGYMKWIESFGVEAVQDTVKILQKSDDPSTLALMAFAAVVAAPICEEIVFRGYLYGIAKKFAGPWAAAVCTALVFGAAHGSLAALLPLFVFGLLLVLVYERTGSIWAPMALHFCFNGATVVIQMALRYSHFPAAPGL